MDGVSFQLRWQHLCKNFILRIVLLLCLTLTTQLTQAKTLLLLSSKVSYYQEVSDSIKANTSAHGIPNKDFTTLTVEQFKQQRESLNRYNLIVAIGTAAATEAFRHESEVPLLNIFIPKNAYDSIREGNTDISTRKVSAIYLDQPLNRLITLARLLKPTAKKIGTIFGPISQSARPEIEALAKAGGIELKYGFLSKEDNPVSTLKPVVTKSELFMAIPDHAILNKAIARWILYMSFQYKIPVIGFSNAYTNAGAIASVYSSPEDIGKQAAEVISDWVKGDNHSMWEPVFPRYFTLSTNPSVARSLGISLPSTKELYTLFKQKEAMEDDK